MARDLRRSKRLAAVAVASLTFQLLYIFAVRDVGAGVATLVTLGIGPVLLHTIEAVGARAMPSPRTRLVLVLAVAGLALVATGQQSGDVAPHPLLGLAEASLSGLTCAASASWSRPLAQRMPPLTITLATSAVSVVLLLPVVALTGWSGPRTVPAVSGVLWLGVVTTVVAYGLFYAGLRTTPSSTAMVVTLLEPATAVILAALVLSEPLTAASAAGGALLLTSVAALYVGPVRPRPATGVTPAD